MPRGTLAEAPTVSSDACADASKPVIVYAGQSAPGAKRRTTPSVSGRTPPPAEPLKLAKVKSRDGFKPGAKANSPAVSAADTSKIQWPLKSVSPAVATMAR